MRLRDSLTRSIQSGPNQHIMLLSPEVVNLGLEAAPLYMHVLEIKSAEISHDIDSVGVMLK